jgi:lipid-A-disaccharide synthase
MLAPAFDVLRELGHALVELLLAPFRHLWGLATRDRRLADFATLEASPLVDLTARPEELPPLRDLVLSVGDASGEEHAREILAALRPHHPELAARGFGGRVLAADGMEVWTPLADLNVMGFRDVAAQLPLFVRAVARFSRELRARRPDAVLLVDYPGLNRHLMRIARRLGVPTVQFVAPQLWAWAPWRVRDFRRADRLLAILPFEPDWYRRHGARADFIGHPLGDELPAGFAPLPADGEPLRVAILPGSRRREVEQNLPLMLEAAAAVRRARPDTVFVLPHLREERWPRIEALLATHPELAVETRRGEFHEVLLDCHGCLVVSGTASLEASMLGLATVVVYALPSRLAAWLARYALAVPHIASANLIAGRRMVPEHLGRHLDPEAIAADLLAQLAPDTARARRSEVEALREATMAPGCAARSALALEQAVADHRTLDSPVR